MMHKKISKKLRARAQHKKMQEAKKKRSLNNHTLTLPYRYAEGKKSLPVADAKNAVKHRTYKRFKYRKCLMTLAIWTPLSGSRVPSRLEMSWAAMRPTNELTTGLFTVPPTAQFYLLFLTGPLTICQFVNMLKILISLTLNNFCRTSNIALQNAA